VPDSDRIRPTNLRIADGGSRSGTGQRYGSRDRTPIATTFSRKIMRCRRCGSRVVSNAKRCPYCGKSLIPFYQSFVFWLGVVAFLGAGAIYFIFFYDPIAAQFPGPESRPPVSYGLIGRNDTAELPIGTTVDCDGMVITLIAVTQELTAADGRPIYEATVQIYNRSSTTQRLLNTQWVMRTAGGGFEECYIGQTDSGNSLTSGIEGRQLAPGEVLNAKIYFAAEIPVGIVYLVNPLETSSENEVSWLINYQSTPPSD